MQNGNNSKHGSSLVNMCCLLKDMIWYHVVTSTLGEYALSKLWNTTESRSREEILFPISIGLVDTSC